MKKLAIIFSVLILTIGLSNGQTVKVQFGRDWANLKLYDIDDQYSGYHKSLSGYVVFLGVDFLNRKYFNLSSNLGYFQKLGENGIWEGTGNQNSTLMFGKTDLRYLSIDTRFDLNYPINDKIIPFINVGPRLDYLISNTYVFDRMRIMNSTVFGLIMGGGLKYCDNNIQLGFCVDYCLSFNNTGELPAWPNHPDMTGFLSEEQIKENTILFCFTVGYIIK